MIDVAEEKDVYGAIPVAGKLVPGYFLCFLIVSLLPDCHCATNGLWRRVMTQFVTYHYSTRCRRNYDRQSKSARRER